jgi:hypothetical protein
MEPDCSPAGAAHPYRRLSALTQPFVPALRPCRPVLPGPTSPLSQLSVEIEIQHPAGHLLPFGVMVCEDLKRGPVVKLREAGAPDPGLLHRLPPHP